MSLFKLILIVIFSGSAAFAQNVSLERLYEFYQKKQFRQLQEAVAQLKTVKQNKADLIFYKALFIEDGEQAMQQFARAFEQGSPQIKNLAAKKLMDYFYAIGYYVTAKKYQKFIVEHALVSDTVTENDPGPTAAPQKYYIQVGAFGLEENARQRVQFLGTQDIRAEVVKRSVNDKTLYCVWIEAEPDLDKSIDYANKIKQKFDLQFQIMKK